MQNSTSGKWYDSLEAAVAEAGSGDVLTLSDRVALASTVVIDKDLMIDLNGKDIVATDCRALWVKAGDVALVGEGTVSANGDGLGETSSVIRVGDGAANEGLAKLTVGEGVSTTDAGLVDVKALDSETVSIVVPVAAEDPDQFFSLGVRE